MTAAPVWLTTQIILAIHDEQIAEHGGASGLRDSTRLDSALARPTDQHVYRASDIAELAAFYAIAIARNHPFIDGNKRTAYVALELFLDANGYDFTASDADSVIMMLGMASGETSDAAFVEWVRGWVRRRG